jgi:hypothetical protein
MAPAVTLTAAHWIYLLGIVAIVVAMVRRVNVVLPAMLATFITAFAFSGKPTLAFESVFMGSLVAGKELLNIYLVIALMIALLRSLSRINADTTMIRPFRVLMRNGHLAYLVLGAVTYVVSLFFWPTPTVPLMAGILLPAAIAAGLSPLGGALCIAVAGEGMALSSDYIIKIAPGISANAAGVPLAAVADKALVLSLITGGVAFVLCYFLIRKDIRVASLSHLEEWEQVDDALPADGGPARGKSPAAVTRLSLSPAMKKWSHLVAIITPVAFLAVVVDMIMPKLIPGFKAPQGAAAAAMVGGVAGSWMLCVAVIGEGRNAFKAVAGHITEGLVYAFRAMGQVLPIAGFFFIGVATLAGPILGIAAGQKAPGFLFELVRAGDAWIPHNRIFATFGVLVSGMVTGIDGSGFAGLPLTGAISGALGRSLNIDVSTLAAVGQMGAVWTGKTLTAWSAVVMVAAFTRVSVLEVVRKLFVPVVCGLFAATLFAIIAW